MRGGKMNIHKFFVFSITTLTLGLLLNAGIIDNAGESFHNPLVQLITAIANLSFLAYSGGKYAMQLECEGEK